MKVLSRSKPRASRTAEQPPSATRGDPPPYAPEAQISRIHHPRNLGARDRRTNEYGGRRSSWNCGGRLITGDPQTCAEFYCRTDIADTDNSAIPVPQAHGAIPVKKGRRRIKSVVKTGKEEEMNKIFTGSEARTRKR